MAHHCHATGCTTETAPAMFMCKRHWFTLPYKMRRDIYHFYREGQEDDKQPSRNYCVVAKAAVVWMAEHEGLVPDTQLYDIYLRDPETK